MKKRIILSGYGNVGREFVRLLNEKYFHIRKKYDLELILSGVIGSRGCVFNSSGLDLKLLYSLGKGSDAIIKYKDLSECDFSDKNQCEGDVLVEAAHTDILTGEPGLSIAKDAVNKKMDIVFLSKGALVTNFKELSKLAKDNKVRLKYSGATAAALPTMDVGYYSLAGSEITAIKGILNGTTNYILTEMFDKGINYKEVVKLLQNKGIYESDMDLDVKGIDSACKLVLLSNSLLNTEFSLKDVKIQGIDAITAEAVKDAKDRGKAVKLISKTSKEGRNIKLEVGMEEIDSSELLYCVNGTNKGVVFYTDTMGEVAAVGGASNPKGAAAAALKDIINLYRLDM
jgi:homoserine dehydrogenase